MVPKDHLRVGEEILKPLRGCQRKSILLVVQGVAWIAQATSIAVADFISQTTGSQLGSSLTRFYRPLLIGINWTEWHPPLRMWLSSVIRGTRPIPVYASVFNKTQIQRSQNIW